MKIIVRGVVQGVGFRPQVARIARRLGLRGYVKNVGSYVEIFVDGSADGFLEELRRNLPPLSSVESMELVDEPATVAYNGFEIAPSGSGYRNYMFPTDTALCVECLHEVFDSSDRRYHYPFTNCVSCGARYSVITGLPYDRERTSMAEFPMCELCLREFSDDQDRRYDAQTISCPSCGPRYALYGRNGAAIETADPIAAYASSLDEGAIGVAKSWGGMHISVTLERSASFRSWYGRPTKPFAVMVKDTETAGKYFHMSPDEEQLLTSRQRPIVLLDKKDTSDSTMEAVSPGLPNVGVYLPYTGMHSILFSHLRHDAIISTSANFSDEPMIIDDGSVFTLGADRYLLHNRRIVNRTDDSVVRVIGGRNMFIRRSRGYVPDIFRVAYGGSFLSLGSEMNARISLTKDGYMFSSQYLGDISHYNNMMFMEQTVRSFMRMLDVERLDGIAMDMHPQFAYRRFAAELSAESSLGITAVQHHHAHAASLMLDNGSEHIVAVALDGTGYGTDGRVWGGEVLDADMNGFSRVASLEEIPLVGAEAAIREPGRTVNAIKSLLGLPLEAGYDPDLYPKIIRRSIRTTSFGRVLDAIAAYLGVCSTMRYDGEPAMRLELLLSRGSDAYGFDADTGSQDGRKTVLVLPLFEQLFSLRLSTFGEKADAAYSMVKALVKTMAELGREHAEGKGVPLGLTGGVSYNGVVTRMFLEAAGDAALLHRSIPNGDGGISAGQNAVVARCQQTTGQHV